MMSVNKFRLVDSASRRPTRRKNDRGMVAIEFVAGICLLLIPITMLVLSFPTWAERQMFARTAAREAARVYALTADQTRATEMAQQVAANYQIPPEEVQITFAPYPEVPIEPGDTADASITVRVPPISIGLFTIDSGEFDYTNTHQEPIDVFRSRG